MFNAKKKKKEEAQVIIWISHFFEKDITLNLKPFKIAHETWKYLKKIYAQTNHAR